MKLVVATTKEYENVSQIESSDDWLKCQQWIADFIAISISFLLIVDLFVYIYSVNFSRFLSLFQFLHSRDFYLIFQRPHIGGTLFRDLIIHKFNFLSVLKGHVVS